MKRDIKFRAWDGETMISKSINDEYDDYFMLTLQGDFLGHTRTGDEYFEYSKDETNKKEFVLMQYTGLKDKNGIEIYEGDIIQYKQHYFNWDHTETLKKEVKWKHDRWNIFETNAGESDIEIIGNIFGHTETNPGA